MARAESTSGENHRSAAHFSGAASVLEANTADISRLHDQVRGVGVEMPGDPWLPSSLGFERAHGCGSATAWHVPASHGVPFAQLNASPFDAEGLQILVDIPSAAPHVS